MSGTTHLADAVLGELVSLAEATPAVEVCGFVVRGEGQGGIDVVPARNRADDPARGFVIDPGDLLRVLRRAEREGGGILAIYHSHPSGGAALSARDLAGLAAETGPFLPGAEVWVLALERGRAVELRAYSWVDGGYSEVARRCAPFTF